MRLSRRSILRAGSLAALGLLAGVAEGGEPVALVVYDSRSWRSRAFARRFVGPRIDVARERGCRWAGLRRPAPAGRIVGLTRWNDHVIARGYLEEQRKRLATDRRQGDLFYWEMA